MSHVQQYVIMDNACLNLKPPQFFLFDLNLDL